MKTRVRIVPKMDLHALGVPCSRYHQVQMAVKTAASELGGKLVDELVPIDGHHFYALPKRQRREKVGFVVDVTKISKRYVYAQI